MSDVNYREPAVKAVSPIAHSLKYPRLLGYQASQPRSKYPQGFRGLSTMHGQETLDLTVLATCPSEETWASVWLRKVNCILQT